MIDPFTLQTDAPAITEGDKTGEPGDGKVFVLPVESAHQIRTGASGTEAV